MERERESDVISLGDEEEIQSNPSPGPALGDAETTFEREITKIMDDSSLGGDWNNASIISNLSSQAESTLEKVLSQKDESVNEKDSSQKNDKLEVYKEIDVIILDSSTESDKDNKETSKTMENSPEKILNKDPKLSDSKLTLAGDFGFSLSDIKVEDDDEDNETMPKIIVPFSKLSQLEENDDDDEDEFEDESIMERVCALSEMFPDPVRNGASLVYTGAVKGVKGLYGFTRGAVWIVATSGLILAAPVMIQSEMTQMEEMNKQQQRQILLGPNAASSGGLSPNLAQPIR